MATGLAGAAVLLLPVPAAHATAYRYWTYWHISPGATSWQFAGSGPSYRPNDGGVEGWRFAVSTGTTSAPQPRTGAAAAYEDVCGGTTHAAGRKLVALVVDFGTQADAPAGEHPPGGDHYCVDVAKNASGYDVLATAGVSVREKGGLVCGLDGYPRSECAPVVKTSPSAGASPSGKPTSKPSQTPSHGPSATASATRPSRSPAASSGTATGEPSTSGARSASSAAPAATKPPDAAAAPSETTTGGSTTTTADASDVASSGAAAVAAGAASPVAGSAAATGGGSPWPLVVGGLLVAVLVGAALLQRRRRPA